MQRLVCILTQWLCILDTLILSDRISNPLPHLLIPKNPHDPGNSAVTLELDELFPSAFKTSEDEINGVVFWVVALDITEKAEFLRNPLVGLRHRRKMGLNTCDMHMQGTDHYAILFLIIMPLLD